MPKPKKVVEPFYISSKNTFSILDNSSDSEVEVESEEVESEVEEMKRKEVNEKKDENTDKEGWTKVQWNKPQFIDSDKESVDSEIQIKKELEEEALESVEMTDVVLPPVTVFPSFLNRGTINTVVWAEKIKQSIEKAESTRKNSLAPGIKPTEEFVSGLGTVSFFSKPST